MGKGLDVLFTHKTAKGTELPVVGIHGKPYLQVAHRIIWLREEQPLWGIETEIKSLSPTAAYVRAVIKDETGRVLATSHKFESVDGFTDFIEKAETGAIGRALALVGFGTQFTGDDFDEKDRLADSPTIAPKAKTVATQAPPSNQPVSIDSLREKVITVGFLNGQKFKETDPYELRKQYDYWLKRKEDARGSMSAAQNQFVQDAALWLMQFNPGEKPKAPSKPKVGAANV